MIANIAACFSKEFTGIPNTMCELLQGNHFKVWDAWTRYVEPAEMSHMPVCFKVKPLTFYLDSPFNSMYKHSHYIYRIYVVSAVCPQLYCNWWSTFPTGSDHQWKARVYMLHKAYLWQVMIILQSKSYSLDKKIKMDGHTDTEQSV